MKLSKNLSLAEFTRSSTAKRRGIDNNPDKDHLEAAKQLADNIFQPIREHFGKAIFISSGYRSDALNKAIGGSATSQHSKGEAIDIDMDGYPGPSNTDVFEYIKDNLPFDICNELNLLLQVFSFFEIDRDANTCMRSLYVYS